MTASTVMRPDRKRLARSSAAGRIQFVSILSCPFPGDRQKNFVQILAPVLFDQFLRRAVIAQLAFVDEYHAVADLFDLFHVMRSIQHRYSPFILYAQEQLAGAIS